MNELKVEESKLLEEIKSGTREEKESNLLLFINKCIEEVEESKYDSSICSMYVSQKIFNEIKRLFKSWTDLFTFYKEKEIDKTGISANFWGIDVIVKTDIEEIVFSTEKYSKEMQSV